MGSLPLELFQSCGDVVLRVSGHGGMGQRLGLVILELFSYLNDHNADRGKPVTLLADMNLEPAQRAFFTVQPTAASSVITQLFSQSFPSHSAHYHPFPTQPLWLASQS